MWKDVDGVLTADPRIVDSATPVSRLTFEEARRAPVPAHQSCTPFRRRGWPCRVQEEARRMFRDWVGLRPTPSSRLPSHPYAPPAHPCTGH